MNAASLSSANDPLPVPPLRLRRMRLQGVGPDGARFDPLDLDFTTSDGAASRVLLSLTNTGGKSTLITLVSSLVVPASRAQVGRKNLGDYVLTGDTSHIVCEWEDAATGTRTVTGTVMEWKDGRRQPGHRQRSTTNMHRAWYLFRTGAGLPGIDDLPFIVDGRRAIFAKYTSTIDSLISPYAEPKWVLTRTQQDWNRALEKWTSIDPILFGYQMRMNDSEAGAEKLLATFDSPDNVVRFFVAALNDDREITDFIDKLGKYADLAAQRPALEALNGFCVEVGSRIELIAERADNVETAAAATVQARVAGGEHARALDNRIAQDRTELTELDEAVTNASNEAAKARREYGQISDIRLQLQLEEARARLGVAKEAVAERTTAAEEAALEAEAWDAVDTVVEVARLRAERDSAKTAYDTAQRGLQPLRDRVTLAAAELAGRLNGLAEEAQVAAEAADGRVTAARNEARRAFEAEKEAALRHGNTERELSQIDNQIRTAEDATTAAVEAGWLIADEPPVYCLRRWQQARGRAKELAAQEDEKAHRAEKTRDDLDVELDALEGDLAILRSTAQADQDRLEAFDSDLDAVRSHDVIPALLGGSPVSTADISRAAELAERAAHDADVRAAEHERLAQLARNDLAHLDETGTAPTGPDVLIVLEVLLDARIGAVTGLEWIENNVVDADARLGFIEAHPDIAGGVIVSDPGRFESAAERLAKVEPRIRTPVTVATAPTSAASFNDTAQPRLVVPHRQVVVPHRATWDREWAATTRAELDEIAKTEGTAAVQARASATSYRNAAAACTGFSARWKETVREDLARRSADSATQVEKAINRRNTLRSGRERHRNAAHNARERANSARSDAALAEKHATLASGLVEITTSASTAAARRSGFEAALTTAERDQAAAVMARESAEAEAEACTQAAADARSAGEVWQRERDNLGIENAAPDPGGNLEVVRTAWHTLHQELSAAERGMVEAELLNRAERALSEALGRHRRHDPEIRVRAERLATTTPASSRESLIGAQRRARMLATTREKQRLTAEHNLKVAAADVQATQPPSDRQNHFDLANAPEWSPATPADIPELLERLESHNVRLRERRDAAEQKEKDNRELHESIAADIEMFTDLRALWPEEVMPTDRVFTGSKDAARTTMRTLLATHTEAGKAEHVARDRLRSAVSETRAVAADVRWRDLDAPAAVRIRSLQEPDLVAEAGILTRRIHAMARSASADLADMDKHRTILRDGLVALCRDQRRLLREVTKASRLPAGPGDLPRQPAIKIHFEDAPDDEAAARLAARIDSWATELALNPKRASSAEVRARWLADAVRDTVRDRVRAGAWSIEILKPRVDGRVIHCPPDRIPHEFSGGQVLTLAVLVYCALSGVRSAHRPGGARPPGALILDNPFGAASAETLIEMQHRLAAQTGLQLICATGLNDANVDNAFTGRGSVIVKLRNDGDLRRNLSFLRLRTRVVDGVDIANSMAAGRAPTSPQNWVEATRYEVHR